MKLPSASGELRSFTGLVSGLDWTSHSIPEHALPDLERRKLTFCGAAFLGTDPRL